MLQVTQLSGFGGAKAKKQPTFIGLYSASGSGNVSVPALPAGRYVVGVMVSGDATGTNITGLTLLGQAFSVVASSAGEGNIPATEFYIGTLPSGLGAGTAAVTISSGFDGASVAIWSVDDEAVVVGANGRNLGISNTSTSTTLPVASAPGDFHLHVVAYRHVTTSDIVWPSPVVERDQYINSGAASSHSAADREATTALASGLTTTVTLPSATTNRSAMSSIVVRVP